MSTSTTSTTLIEKPLITWRIAGREYYGKALLSVESARGMQWGFKKDLYALGKAAAVVGAPSFEWTDDQRPEEVPKVTPAVNGRVLNLELLQNVIADCLATDPHRIPSMDAICLFCMLVNLSAVGRWD